MGLCWQHVDFAAGTIHVTRETSKSKRARTLPMHSEARAARGELYERTGARGGRVLDAVGYNKVRISEGFRAAAESVSLNGVTMHTLRHTFATRLNAPVLIRTRCATDNT